jgi:hypothetical protein
MATSKIVTSSITDDAVTSGKIASGVVPTLRPNAQPLIINGDMAVAQRTTSTSSVSSGANYVSDRFGFNPATAGTWTISQEAITSGSPFDNGFRTAFKADNTTANGSLSAGSSLQFTQKIEAQDLQVLKYGSSNAEKMTLSFWVKATKTGTNVIEIYAHDSGRSVSVAYTVSTTNTWEKKTVAIPADTGGTINNDNGAGLEVIWWLAAGTNFTSGSLQTSWGANTATARAVGQVNNADSTSNNIHITAVQLEVGEYTSSTIPPFQFESFGGNLARCQRYYYKYADEAENGGSDTTLGITNSYNGGSFDCIIPFPVSMRSKPSIEQNTGSNMWRVYSNNANDTFTALSSGADSNNTESINVQPSTSVSLTQGNSGILQTMDNTAYLSFSAEL